MTPTEHQKNSGFTLIEIIVVIAIMGILTAMSIQGWRVFSTHPGSDAAARTVLGAIEEAHARTLAAENDMQYGVHFDTIDVTLFEGDTYASGAPTNNVRALPARTTITAVTLTSGASDIVFSRLRGNASATGTITVAITADLSHTRTITVTEAGLMEISQ